MSREERIAKINYFQLEFYNGQTFFEFVDGFIILMNCDKPIKVFPL